MAETPHSHGRSAGVDSHLVGEVTHGFGSEGEGTSQHSDHGFSRQPDDAIGYALCEPNNTSAVLHSLDRGHHHTRHRAFDTTTHVKARPVPFLFGQSLLALRDEAVIHGYGREAPSPSRPWFEISP